MTGCFAAIDGSNGKRWSMQLRSHVSFSLDAEIEERPLNMYLPASFRPRGFGLSMIVTDAVMVTSRIHNTRVDWSKALGNAYIAV